MANYFNISEWMRQRGISNMMNITPDQERDLNLTLWGQSGLVDNSWRNIQGQSTRDFANQKASTLFQYNGYYDNNQYEQLVAGLGGTSSDTLLKQISARNASTSRVYNLMTDYNAFRGWWQQGTYPVMVGDNGIDLFTNPRASDREKEVQAQNAWLSMQQLGEALRQEQSTLADQLTAQYGREQNFLSGVTGLTQSATQNKLRAEQQAAQQKLNEQYAAGQAAINQQAEQNAAAVAAQQAAQDKQYAEAQAAAAKAAEEQQVQLNTTAQTTALANAATSAKQQAELSVQNMEQRANTLQGNPTVLTNASSTSKQRGNTNRTDRWLSRRAPAAGGGGANI